MGPSVQTELPGPLEQHPGRFHSCKKRSFLELALGWKGSRTLAERGSSAHTLWLRLFKDGSWIPKEGAQVDRRLLRQPRNEELWEIFA